ncbi:MAG: Tetratricopeptide 2 repeat protein [Myxococcales bacterium]|nr:Tetratricopeptide 2 repeat protein [Myxococcales bacterium]
MGYSAEDVAKLLGVSVRQVQSYVRAGFLAPEADSDGQPRFTFQDVVLLRTAKGLVGARIAPSRVKRALARLKQQLPEGRPLTGVAIAAEGNRIVVRDGGAQWNPESGQVLFDFRVAELAKEAASLRRNDDVRELKPRKASGAIERTPAEIAEDWYQVGCTREDEGDAEGAIAAYRQAIATESGQVDAHINLGRLLHERGDGDEARALYERALALRPDDPLAAFNLGVALEDCGRVDDALAAYRRAIEADPRSADAHYNLAGLYERLGDRAAAIRHLRTYKKLTGR